MGKQVTHREFSNFSWHRIGRVIILIYIIFLSQLCFVYGHFFTLRRTARVLVPFYVREHRARRLNTEKVLAPEKSRENNEHAFAPRTDRRTTKLMSCCSLVSHQK